MITAPAPQVGRRRDSPLRRSRSPAPADG